MDASTFLVWMTTLSASSEGRSRANDPDSSSRHAFVMEALADKHMEVRCEGDTSTRPRHKPTDLLVCNTVYSRCQRFGARPL